jgi:hypothetical protein
VRFDAQNIFFGSSPYTTTGNYVSLAALTASGTTSTVINLGVAEDLGIGSGKAIPRIAVVVGTGITSASSGLRLNWQFQGSTDSTNWTTYAETGANATSSFEAGEYILPIAVPRRPSGVALPQYYRMAMAVTGITNETISAGTIFGGIILARDDARDTLGQYPSGFSVGA